MLPGEMLVELTFRGPADPAVLERLRADGWSVLASSSRAAVVEDDLEQARARFFAVTDLDPDHVVWRCPQRSGAVPRPPSTTMPPKRVPARRLPITGARR